MRTQVSTTASARFQTSGRSLLVGNRLDHNERDQQRKEHERLDKRERDDHERLHGSGCTRIAGSTFGGTRTNESLTDSGETGGQSETDASTDRLCSVDGELVVTSSGTGLRHRRQSRDDHRKCCEKQVS